jgi:hypothetical protein
VTPRGRQPELSRSSCPLGPRTDRRKRPERLFQIFLLELRLQCQIAKRALEIRAEFRPAARERAGPESGHSRSGGEFGKNGADHSMARVVGS